MCKVTVILAEAVKAGQIVSCKQQQNFFFHSFKQCEFDKLDVVCSSRFIIHSEQRAQDLTVFDRHVTCHLMS